MYKPIAASLVTLVLGVMPLVSHAADDSRITSITMGTQSDSAAGASADYSLTLVTSSTIASGERVTFFVSEQGGGDANSSGFDFSATTFVSPEIMGNGAIVNSNAFYGITLTGDLAAGTYDLQLSGVMNSTTEGSYVWAATSATELGPDSGITFSTDAFTIGSGGGSDEGPGGDGLTLLAFGTNIAVSWPAYSGAATYELMISLTEDIVGADAVSVGAATSYVYSDLEPNTTYYIAITGFDSNGGQVIVPYQTVSTTTAAALSSTRYTKPTVPKKKIKATTATVNWTVGDDADYIDGFWLKLKLKNKTVKTYKNISADAMSKKLKKLKPGKNYSVQLRALYVTDEMTKWSKAVEFKTKTE